MTAVLADTFLAARDRDIRGLARKSCIPTEYSAARLSCKRLPALATTLRKAGWMPSHLTTGGLSGFFLAFCYPGITAL